MADTKTFTVAIENEGDCIITEEVVLIIAGLGAFEVEGVGSLVGNLTSQDISKAGLSKLSKAIKVTNEGEKKIGVRLAVNIKYGYELPTVSKNIQEKVKTAIENMTGIEVTKVDISINQVIFDN